MVDLKTERVGESLGIVTHVYFIATFALALSLCMNGRSAYAQSASDRSQSAVRGRVALVIGNAAYRIGRLANPVNDATDVATSLRAIGFTVTLATDLDYSAMRSVIGNFTANLQDDAAALVFFAGHGVQHNGANFLLPIDASNKIQSPQDLDRFAISLSRLTDDLTQRRGGISIILLDACRNSPFASSTNIVGGLSRGLSRTSNQTGSGLSSRRSNAIEGALIGYSTSPNTTAQDGSGRNSPYVKHLKEALRRPNASLETILKLTRSGVTRDTNGEQTPWYESSVNGDFYPANRGWIDFIELLKLFVPPGPRGNVSLFSWTLGSEEFSSIKWFHDGIRVDDWTSANAPRPTQNIPKIQDFNNASLGAYRRDGEVVITVDGQPTHHILRGREEAVAWTVSLAGPRGGVQAIRLDSKIISQELGSLRDPIFMKVDPQCNQGGITDGTSVFQITLPDRDPAWLAEWRSCGSAGCYLIYYIFYSKDLRKNFGCSS